MCTAHKLRVDTSKRARNLVSSLLAMLEGVELHRDRTLPSTDSRALNGLIFWFEGYYFRQSGA